MTASGLLPFAPPLEDDERRYDALLELVGAARVVLIGEATHGTHEFYAERAAITRRLIEEMEFTVVAVEADWPDAYRVNRYVRGGRADADADHALSGFRRFPTWMWRNSVVVEFVEWLRRHNQSRAQLEQTGFYGLDLYSLFTSIEEVLMYLDRVDPAAAARARYRYSCFEHFGEDSQAYGYAAGFDISRSCEDAVIAQLLELRRNAGLYSTRDGFVARGEYFYAEQNARLILDAEHYYREMFRGRVSSWNLRDRHMERTLSSLLEFLDRERAGTKAVVWAHNSHVGDARATEMGRAGELNVGQLARQHYGSDCINVGFSTYQGTVTAASNWDAPAERKRVRPAIEGSYEALFHETGMAKFLLPLKSIPQLRVHLGSPRLQRAIGVIYLPSSERASHYFYATLSEQFDVMIHIDATTAIHPLEKSAEWHAGEPPETFPSGI